MGDILEIKGRATDRHDGSNEAYSCPDEPEAGLEYLTPGELAALCRTSVRTIEKWTLKKRLPVVKFGRLNRFPRVEIQKRLLNGSLLK